jgi:carboxylesterase
MTLKGIDGQADRHLTGVMILHGFTANLDSVRALFGPLAGMGLNLVTPLLRGHGQHSPDALRGVTWQDWLTDAEQAMTSSAGVDGKLIVLGHSMGALLALHLAARHPELVDSVILATPAIRLASLLAPGRPLHFLAPFISAVIDRWDVQACFADPACAIKPAQYCWAPTATIMSLFDLVQATIPVLSRVSAPTLIIHGRNESIVLPESVDIIMHDISTPSDEKSVVWLEKSEHQIFCDCERDIAVSAVREFIAGRIGK